MQCVLSYLSGQPTVSQNELRSGQNLTLTEWSFDYLMQLAGRFTCIFFKCFAGKLKSSDRKGIHLVCGLSGWLDNLQAGYCQKFWWNYQFVHRNTIPSVVGITSALKNRQISRYTNIFLKYNCDQSDSPQFISIGRQAFSVHFSCRTS